MNLKEMQGILEPEIWGPADILFLSLAFLQKGVFCFFGSINLSVLLNTNFRMPSCCINETLKLGKFYARKREKEIK